MEILLAERKILLTKIAEDDSNSRNEHLRGSGVELANFHKELQPDIVDQNIETDNQHIAHELVPATEGRLRKGNVFIEQKTREKRYRESNAEGKDMWRNGQWKTEQRNIHHISESGEKKMVEKEIEHPVKHHVSSSATSVAEELPRNDFFHTQKRKNHFFIEKINNFGYYGR